MEIHVPHQAARNRRELLTHLGLVTAGAVIALSFEGIVTWREHRALVREARANITSEIRDNHKELANRLKKIPAEGAQLERALDVAQQLLQHKEISGSMQLGFVAADLGTASRTTAEVTGAFALMEYDEVKKFASVYSHQELYARFQNQAMQDLTRAMSMASTLGRNETPSVREIEDWRAAVRQTLSALFIEEQLGATLLKEYESIVGKQEP